MVKFCRQDFLIVTSVCCIAICRVTLLKKSRAVRRVIFEQCYEINWQQTRVNQSENLAKTKFYHEWYSDDYFMNKETKNDL